MLLEVQGVLRTAVPFEQLVFYLCDDRIIAATMCYSPYGALANRGNRNRTMTCFALSDILFLLFAFGPGPVLGPSRRGGQNHKS